jgi:hypothetical protein
MSTVQIAPMNRAPITSNNIKPPFYMLRAKALNYGAVS